MATAFFFATFRIIAEMKIRICVINYLVKNNTLICELKGCQIELLGHLAKVPPANLR